MEHLKDTLKHPNLHIGMRNVKTALTATLCALLYFPFGRNPTFACIGAVFGMGYDMAGSKLHGGNRLFGTAFGGLIAMAMFRIYIIFYPDGRTSPLMMLFLFIGVVLLILVSQNLWPGAVQPGSVVLCIIFFNTPVETYVSYSLNRILDTGIGVVVAIIVNYLLPRERLVRWLEFLHLRKKEIDEFDIESYDDDTNDDTEETAEEIDEMIIDDTDDEYPEEYDASIAVNNDNSDDDDDIADDNDDEDDASIAVNSDRFDDDDIVDDNDVNMN